MQPSPQNVGAYILAASGSKTTSEGSDKYTDTKPSVIKKELAEGQLYQMQEKHQTTREGPDKYTQTPDAREAPDHKGRPRQVHGHQAKCD